MKFEYANALLIIAITSTLSYLVVLLPNLGSDDLLVSAAFVAAGGAPLYLGSGVATVILVLLGNRLGKINIAFCIAPAAVATASVYALYSRHDLFVNDGLAIFPGSLVPALVVLWVYGVMKIRGRDSRT